jgi:hypothetical protein
MQDAAIEATLDRHRFPLGHDRSIFPTRSGIDQRAAGGILNDELVAEDVGDLAFDGHRGGLAHIADRCRLQQHHALRLPVLRQPSAARA